MTDTKKAEELNEAELDQVTGGATKGLVGDDAGILRGGDTVKPGTKGYGTVTGEGPGTF